MDAAFVDRLEEEAIKRKARIGIGLSGGGSEILKGIEPASKYAEIVIVGDPGCDCPPELELMPAQDPAAELVGALDVHAVEERPFRLQGRGAGRAGGRHVDRARRPRAPRLVDLDDGGDHVARALDLDAVALPDVARGDQAPVVQGRAPDGDAGQLDRLELGDGRDRAGPADLGDDADDPLRGSLDRVR